MKKDIHPSTKSPWWPEYSAPSKPYNYEDVAKEIMPTNEDISCELQLQVIGDLVPLDFHISHNEYWENVKIFEDKDWFRPFQPKEGITNDRESVLLYGLEGDLPTSVTGLSHIEAKLGYMPNEDEFKYPTIAYKELTCIHSVFEYFDMGRSFFIRLNAGGFYPWHRDHYYLKRETFRLIAFLGNSNNDHLHWVINGMQFNALPNTVYYVDTRKAHRLNASHHKCDMIVMNVKKDWTNVNRLLTHVKHKGG
jgi:hypothetical protein